MYTLHWGSSESIPLFRWHRVGRYVASVDKKASLNQRINAKLDKRPKVLWLVVFLGTSLGAALIAFAFLQGAEAVTPKGVNVLGSALVALGLAAQAADGMTEPKSGQHARRRIPAFGFIVATAGASAVFAGQVLS